MTDNAFAYTKCRPFKAPLPRSRLAGRTTNRNAERFIQIAFEWLLRERYTSPAAYAAALPAWLPWHNHRRPDADIHAATSAHKLNSLVGDNN